jgi:hypothetical protein
MEMRTIYKLHPGDTIYLVTPEGEIKTITLNKSHFELVDKIKPRFRYAYEYKHGMLYQIESEYNWKYRYKPDDTYIFLVTNELSAEKTEVPLFRVYDTSNNACSSASAERVDTEKYPVFAYTTLELAQEKAKDVLAMNVKNAITKTIKFIVVNDKDNLPIETFEDVKTWNDYIEIIEEYSDKSIIIKLDNNETFKQDKFETYVLEQINEKLESVKDTFEEALSNKQENKIYSHEEAEELARKQDKAEREAKEFKRRCKAFSAITESLYSDGVFGLFHENVIDSLSEQSRKITRQVNRKIY